MSDITNKVIVNKLYNYGLIKTISTKPEGWILQSGLWSPFYINLRPIGNYPSLLEMIASDMGSLIKQKYSEITKIVGLAYAGIPIATAIGTTWKIPFMYTRKIEGLRNTEDTEKAIMEYGDHNLVEGVIEDNDVICMIDDLSTTLNSKIIAKKQIEHVIKKTGKKNVSCKHVIVLIGRELGAKDEAKDNDIIYDALIPFRAKAIHWLKDKLKTDDYEYIMKFFDNPIDAYRKGKKDA